MQCLSIYFLKIRKHTKYIPKWAGHSQIIHQALFKGFKNELLFSMNVLLLWISNANTWKLSKKSMIRDFFKLSNDIIKVVAGYIPIWSTYCKNFDAVKISDCNCDRKSKIDSYNTFEYGTQTLCPLIFLQPDVYHTWVKYLLMEYSNFHKPVFPWDIFPFLCFVFLRMLLKYLVKILAHQSWNTTS